MTAATPPANSTPDSEDTVAQIRARVEALDSEPLSMKWNYNEYAMIRNTNTGRAIANVFAKPFDTFYFNAPADIAFLLAANVSLTAALAFVNEWLDHMEIPNHYTPDGAPFQLYERLAWMEGRFDAAADPLTGGRSAADEA